MIRKLTCILSVLIVATIIAPFSQADQSGAVRNPIVLAHGFASDSDGFFGIPSALNQVGANNLTLTDVSSFENSFARGEELLQQIETFLAVTGQRKVNIIGHSQGGIDARYVAAIRPDLVASVTSLASPHRGSNVADVVAAATFPFTGAVSDLIDALLTIGGDDDASTSSIGSLESLTSAGAGRFNRIFPQALRTSRCRTAPLVNIGSFFSPRFVRNYSVNNGRTSVNGVRYFSMAGTTTILNNNIFDPIDLALGVTAATFLFERNDAVVGRCSTHLGEVIRDDFVLNHTDFTNATNGLRGLGTNDPLALYKQHARRLKSRGL